MINYENMPTSLKTVSFLLKLKVIFLSLCWYYLNTGCGESIKDFIALGFRGSVLGWFGFCDLKRPHKPYCQQKNRMAFTLSFVISLLKLFIITEQRLHRFSRLTLKKPISVPKQKPRAYNKALGFCFFDRLHAP